MFLFYVIVASNGSAT